MNLRKYCKKTGRNFVIGNPNDKSFAGIKPIVINNKKELERFLESTNLQRNSKTAKTTDESFTFSSPSGRSPGLVHYESLMGIFTYFNIDIYIEGGRTKGGKSYLSGFTPGISYTENHFSLVESYTLSGTTNYFKFNGSGLFRYSIFFEGVGEVFSERVTFSGQNHGYL